MISYNTKNYVKDKVIIITGASSGFGASTARKAAAMGAKVVLAARREDRLKTLVNEIKSAGGEASYIVTDVRVRGQAEAMAQFTVKTYGRIDVLINDAGIMPQAFYADYKQAMPAWEECIDTCIKGTLFCSCAVYDQMMLQESGHVINISSILGNFPVIGNAVYNVAKVGVRYLAEGLRTEGRGKIRVTTVRPTSVSSTELQNSIVNINAAMAGMYGKFFETFSKNPMTCPNIHDKESIQYGEPTADDIADNIIYVINQPMGVDISDVTVRASNESMFV